MQVSTLPLDPEAFERIISNQGFDIHKTSIREMNHLVNAIDGQFPRASGCR